MKNAKQNSGVIGSQSQLKTRYYSKRLSKRPREFFSTIKYKKLLPRISDPGTS